MMGPGPGMPPPPPMMGGRGAGRGERSDGRRDDRPTKTLAELSVTVWLTPENATFAKKNGLLYLTLDGTETRVNLAREFPFEVPFGYISVLDPDGGELGIIRDTALFAGEERALLENELRLRYYAPKVLQILRIRERYGFSYWTVLTEDAGKLTFTMQDAYRSIFRVSDSSVTFCDVDGNRYEVPDLTQLDRASRKRLELYL